MDTNLEERLSRELNEVADGLHVPPMPRVASPGGRRADWARPWQPLVAAAAVIVVLGAVAMLLGRHGHGDVRPAPAPSRTISDAAPTIGYIIDRRLRVEGWQAPGDWASVETRGDVWLAQQVDGSWWWGGPGVDPGQIDAQLEQPPVISPDGAYIAFIDLSGGGAHLTGFDTQPAGEGFGQAPIDPRTEDGVALSIRAVTDDGDVVVQGGGTSLMWRAQHADQQTVVNLGETAPDQMVLQATPAGLVVVDGSDGDVDATSTEPYLADVSPAGHLTRQGALPTYDDLDVSPHGTWLVRAPAGSLGGEVTTVAALDTQPVGEGRAVTLHAPRGWGFVNGTWAWEDDRTLVSALLPPGAHHGGEMARCDVTLGTCRTLPGV